MAVMFGSNGESSLATLHYNIFVKKLTSAKSFVTPERLPPTASSTKFSEFTGPDYGLEWTDNGMDVMD